jgi:hypothetical protein
VTETAVKASKVSYDYETAGYLKIKDRFIVYVGKNSTWLLQLTSTARIADVDFHLSTRGLYV